MGSTDKTQPLHSENVVDEKSQVHRSCVAPLVTPLDNGGTKISDFRDGADCHSLLIALAVCVQTETKQEALWDPGPNVWLTRRGPCNQRGARQTGLPVCTVGAVTVPTPKRWEPRVGPFVSCSGPVTSVACHERMGGSPPAGRVQVHCAAVQERVPQGLVDVRVKAGPWALWPRGPDPEIPIPLLAHHRIHLHTRGSAPRSPLPGTAKGKTESLVPHSPVGHVPSVYCSVLYHYN